MCIRDRLLRPLVPAGQDLEGGHVVGGRIDPVVARQSDHQPVEAAMQVGVEDVRLGGGRVRAGTADLFSQDSVGTRVLGVIERGGGQAAAATRASLGLGKLLGIYTVRNPVQRELDVTPVSYTH